MTAVASRSPVLFSPYGGGAGPVSPNRLQQMRPFFEDEPERDVGEGPSSVRLPTTPGDAAGARKKVGLNGNRTSPSDVRPPAGQQVAVKGKLWEAVGPNHPIAFEPGPKEVSLAAAKYEPINRGIQPGQGRCVLLSAIGPPRTDDSSSDDGGGVGGGGKAKGKAAAVVGDKMEVDGAGKEGGSSPGSGAGESRSSPTTRSVARAPPPAYWTRRFDAGPGFRNEGNTCFLNATLQALVYTPPLACGLLDLDEHLASHCALRERGRYCALCEMHGLVRRAAVGHSNCISPKSFWANLRSFAPTMRLGRQEDAHEFLRFLVDAMQRSALGGKPPEKAKAAEREASFIHRIFGGRLRSRVVCDRCQSPSDTFDTFLDLSLDIHDCVDVRDALRKLKKFDRLTGQNKYKCEKCRSLNDARKFFTVDSCPPILTIHLKRFTAGGKKVGRAIDFGPTLDLSDAMEKGHQGSLDARYELYAVVSHAGGSNNSGHYYAHAKSSDNRWYSFNDTSVEPCYPQRVLGHHNAYILFYAKQRSTGVASAVASLPRPVSPADRPLGKRKGRDDDGSPQDDRAPSPKHHHGPTSNGSVHHRHDSFIGPLRPAAQSKLVHASGNGPRPGPAAAARTYNAPLQKAKEQEEKRRIYNRLSFGDEEDLGTQVPRPPPVKRKNLVDNMKPKILR